MVSQDLVSAPCDKKTFLSHIPTNERKKRKRKKKRTLSPFRILVFCSSVHPSSGSHSRQSHGSRARWCAIRPVSSRKFSMQRLHLNLGTMCCRYICSLLKGKKNMPVVSKGSHETTLLRSGWNMYELDVSHCRPLAVAVRPVRISLRIVLVEGTCELQSIVLNWPLLLLAGRRVCSRTILRQLSRLTKRRE